MLFPAPGAFADEQLVASKAAWFWSSNSKVITCTSDPADQNLCPVVSVGDGVTGGTASGLTEPISTGHVGVSLKEGSSDMRGYVMFDVLSIPVNTKVERFVVTLTVSDPDPQGDHVQRHSEFQGDPPATVNQSAAAMIACAVTEPWGTAEGDPPQSTTVKRPFPESGDTTTEVETTRAEPFSDCSLNATGEPSKDFKTWTFDITAIAQKWVTQELSNEGIALLPVDRGIRPTWTVEFHGPPLKVRSGEDEFDAVTNGEAAKATVVLGGPLPIDDDQPPSPPPPPPPLPPAPQIFPTPPPSPPPVVTPPAPAQPLVPVARSGSAETPGWLYGLIPLGLLGLGLTSSAIGPEVVAAGAGNRVASLLKQRRLGGTQQTGVAEIGTPDEPQGSV